MEIFKRKIHVLKTTRSPPETNTDLLSNQFLKSRFIFDIYKEEEPQQNTVNL